MNVSLAIPVIDNGIYKITEDDHTVILYRWDKDSSWICDTKEPVATLSKANWKLSTFDTPLSVFALSILFQYLDKIELFDKFNIMELK